MSVEILSVALDPQTIEQIAQRVAQLIGGGQQAPTPAPAAGPPAGSTAPAPGQEYDPWAGTNAAPAGAQPGYAAPATAAPAAQPGTYAAGPSAAAPPANPGGPVCAHGPMKYVPGGFSKSTNRPYPAFWACTTPKGAPDKCASVAA